MFFINQAIPIVNIGGNIFRKNGLMLMIDEQNIISMVYSDENRTDLSVNLFDEHDNNVLKIDNNEWESGDYFAWDIEYKPNYIKVRHKEREIAALIDARDQPVKITGSLWHKKQKFIIKPNSLVFSGTEKSAKFSGCIINGTMKINTEKDCLEIFS